MSVSKVRHEILEKIKTKRKEGKYLTLKEEKYTALIIEQGKEILEKQFEHYYQAIKWLEG